MSGVGEADSAFSTSMLLKWRHSRANFCRAAMHEEPSSSSGKKGRAHASSNLNRYRQPYSLRSERPVSATLFKHESSPKALRPRSIRRANKPRPQRKHWPSSSSSSSSAKPSPSPPALRPATARAVWGSRGRTPVRTQAEDELWLGNPLSCIPQFDANLLHPAAPSTGCSRKQQANSVSELHVSRRRGVLVEVQRRLQQQDQTFRKQAAVLRNKGYIPQRLRPRTHHQTRAAVSGKGGKSSSQRQRGHDYFGSVRQQEAGNKEMRIKPPEFSPLSAVESQDFFDFLVLSLLQSCQRMGAVATGSEEKEKKREKVAAHELKCMKKEKKKKERRKHMTSQMARAMDEYHDSRVHVGSLDDAIPAQLAAKFDKPVSAEPVSSRRMLAWGLSRVDVDMWLEFFQRENMPCTLTAQPVDPDGAHYAVVLQYLGLGVADGRLKVSAMRILGALMNVQDIHDLENKVSSLPAVIAANIPVEQGTEVVRRLADIGVVAKVIDLLDSGASSKEKRAALGQREQSRQAATDKDNMLYCLFLADVTEITPKLEENVREILWRDETETQAIVFANRKLYVNAINEETAIRIGVSYARECRLCRAEMEPLQVQEMCAILDYLNSDDADLFDDDAVVVMNVRVLDHLAHMGGTAEQSIGHMRTLMDSDKENTYMSIKELTEDIAKLQQASGGKITATRGDGKPPSITRELVDAHEQVKNRLEQPLLLKQKAEINILEKALHTFHARYAAALEAAFEAREQDLVN